MLWVINILVNFIHEIGGKMKHAEADVILMETYLAEKKGL